MLEPIRGPEQAGPVAWRDAFAAETTPSARQVPRDHPRQAADLHEPGCCWTRRTA